MNSPEVEFLFEVILLVLDYLKSRTLKITQCLDKELGHDRFDYATLSNIVIILRFIYMLSSGQYF
ncbi:hypothetical protein GCM10009426_17950 [Rheinheimera tangshanensis]|nr:hypothetical protein GCM10010920_16340 [Rheinheimera tangshanensis]